MLFVGLALMWRYNHRQWLQPFRVLVAISHGHRFPVHALAVLLS
jgi:hypothetical protein